MSKTKKTGKKDRQTPQQVVDVMRVEAAAPKEMLKPTAEDRAAEIGEKIGECARELKIAPCDLTWFDFREYAGIAWGMNRIGLVRKDITRLGGFNAIRDQYFPSDPTDQGVTRLRLREHANLNRRLGEREKREKFILDEVTAKALKVFKGRVEPIRTERARSRRKVETNRIINLLLSDLHFGSDLLKAETGFLSYGKVEEARRLAQVIQQTVEYKLIYRSQTELRLNLAGDIIMGSLHDQRDGAVRSEQILRAIHLLTQAIAHLAQHFKRIEVHCVTGNHGRDLTRHHGRATVGKHDSHETVIYSACKIACSRLGNVDWVIPTMPYSTYEVFGDKIFVTHGDTVFMTGNPGTSINTRSLENQVNRWNASLTGGETFSVFLSGHVHKGFLIQLDNGAYVITNGALIPVDNYAVSIGIPQNVCSQTIFESVPGYPVGDHRFITLDAGTDKDASLDKIIVPWSGY